MTSTKPTTDVSSTTTKIIGGPRLQLKLELIADRKLHMQVLQQAEDLRGVKEIFTADGWLLTSMFLPELGLCKTVYVRGGIESDDALTAGRTYETAKERDDTVAFLERACAALNPVAEKPALRFEVGKVYVDRAGDQWKVLLTDAPGTHPVVAAAVRADIRFDGRVLIEAFLSNGALFDHEEEHGWDLVAEYVEPAKPREWWITELGVALPSTSDMVVDLKWTLVREVLP